MTALTARKLSNSHTASRYLRDVLDFFTESENAITAHVGGGQGSAYALTKRKSRVTTVGSAADSVVLPAAVVGREMVVANSAAANAMDVFPASGETINALSANAALSVAANKVITFYCFVAGKWHSNLTA